jgi:hypothetical protein
MRSELATWLRRSHAPHVGLLARPGILPSVTGHVFISYSRTDRAYVDRLAAHLTAGGVSTWHDYRLVAGDRFEAEIQHQIDICSAFIVILSPAASASTWVLDEVSYARERPNPKPVLPLLLEATEVPLRLRSLHYEDVRGGRLPSPEFMLRLRAIVSPAEKSVRVTEEVKELRIRVNNAERIGRSNPEKAVDLYRELIPELQRVYGPNSFESLSARKSLAHNLQRAHQYSEAIRAYRELIPDEIQHWGAGFPGILFLRQNLAVAIGDEGDPAEAVRLLRQILVEYEERYGEGHSMAEVCEIELKRFERQGPK